RLVDCVHAGRWPGARGNADASRPRPRRPRGQEAPAPAQQVQGPDPESRQESSRRGRPGTMSAGTTAYIGIGANPGAARDNVEQALRLLDGLPQSRLSARSSLFLSAPIEADGADYVNAVAQLQTALAPEQLLQRLLAMEHDFGRVRSYRNAPRLLDLDILL